MDTYFLAIDTNEIITRVRKCDDDKVYDLLSKHLNGGTLDAVRFEFKDMGISGTMYIDDNGKLDGLPYNRLASAIFLETHRLPVDYIVGPVVLTGPTDDEGYDTGLEDWQVQSIVIWLSQFEYEEDDEDMEVSA